MRSLRDRSSGWKPRREFVGGCEAAQTLSIVRNESHFVHLSVCFGYFGLILAIFFFFV